MFEQLLPELTQWLQQKLENFKDGCISIKIKEWTKVTPDPEILLTVKKLTLEFLKEPSINKEWPEFSAYNVRSKKTSKKGIVIDTAHEEGDQNPMGLTE